jgi:hypothetical protein
MYESNATSICLDSKFSELLSIYKISCCLQRGLPEQDGQGTIALLWIKAQHLLSGIKPLNKFSDDASRFVGGADLTTRNGWTGGTSAANAASPSASQPSAVQRQRRQQWRKQQSSPTGSAKQNCGQVL